jgi:hypothetical protein
LVRAALLARTIFFTIARAACFWTVWRFVTCASPIGNVDMNDNSTPTTEAGREEDSIGGRSG